MNITCEIVHMWGMLHFHIFHYDKHEKKGNIEPVLINQWLMPKVTKHESL